jgi:hypothetical protein
MVPMAWLDGRGAGGWAQELQSAEMEPYSSRGRAGAGATSPNPDNNAPRPPSGPPRHSHRSRRIRCRAWALSKLVLWPWPDGAKTRRSSSVRTRTPATIGAQTPRSASYALTCATWAVGISMMPARNIYSGGCSGSSSFARERCRDRHGVARRVAALQASELPGAVVPMSTCDKNQARKA